MTHHLLPLSKNLKSIAVVGPNANDVKALLGNYYGTPSLAVTPWWESGKRFRHQPRSFTPKAAKPWSRPPSPLRFDEAVAAAKSADVVVVALGLVRRSGK